MGTLICTTTVSVRLEDVNVKSSKYSPRWEAEGAINTVLFPWKDTQLGLIWVPLVYTDMRRTPVAWPVVDSSEAVLVDMELPTLTSA